MVYTFNEADDRLYDFLKNHGFADLDHSLRQQLVKFYLLLMESQKTENFTRLLSLREVAIKHFIDCLMIPKLTKLYFPLIDIGTGPGFPGIPLKLLYPEKRIFKQLAREVCKLTNDRNNIEPLRPIHHKETPNPHHHQPLRHGNTNRLR